MKFTHINPVGLLSLMALPAALWFVNGDRSYLAFLIFLIFLPYFGVKPDEFFLEHVKVAALWAFFAEMAVVTLVILVATFLSGFFCRNNSAGCKMRVSRCVCLLHRRAHCARMA